VCKDIRFRKGTAVRLFLPRIRCAVFRIPLTAAGQQQAREAGKRIREVIGNESLYVYVSPYLRATQTLDCVREALDPKQILATREEPRISEQQVNRLIERG
jgi:broad specificity phosphatase PhoE